MIKHFLNLERKQFFRAPNFRKSLALKMVLCFVAFYFLSLFLTLGFYLYSGLNKAFPDKDPFAVVNGFLFFWFVGDLVLRFFFQSLPIMAVKPLLCLPIKRKSIVHFILGKSVLSLFNYFLLVTIIPFSIILSTHGYSVSEIIIWVSALFLITLIVNFLNFCIESFSSEKELLFPPVIFLVVLLIGLDYFELVKFSEWLSHGILSITKNVFLVTIPILLLVALYIINYALLNKKLYLDTGLKVRRQKIETSHLGWTKHFGESAAFLQLDLKLIWRNKRPKVLSIISIVSILYGFAFFPNPSYENKPLIYFFASIFMSGGFLINFGQLIPAWDSSYYKLIMSQNIKYKNYIKSKHLLLRLSIILMFTLSLPYAFYGWNVFLALFSTALYNLGVNTYIILFAGIFSKEKINLEGEALLNYQGMGVAQWLVSIPLFGIPIALFALFNSIFCFEAGVISLVVCGISGLIFHQKLLALITKKYLSSKYRMISAFEKE